MFGARLREQVAAQQCGGELLDIWAVRETGRKFDELDPPQQAGLQARLQAEVRANTYDATSGVVTLSDDRAQAIAAVAAHYDQLFSGDAALQSLRGQYAIQENPIPDAGRLLLRHLGMAFDAYLASAQASQQRFSKAI